MSVKKNRFSKISEILYFDASQETDPYGAIKEEERESPSKPNSRWKLYLVIGLLNAAVIATAVPLAIYFSNKKKNEQKSLAACGYEPEEVSHTRLSITIDGLDSAIDDLETEGQMEEAIRKAYDQTSGRCDDIYDRWMPESWIYDQRVVTSDANSSCLVIDFMTVVSCDGCPAEEHFASTFGDVANEVRNSEKDVHGFDVVKVIRAIEKWIMTVVGEAEGISKVEISSETAHGMVFTANLSPCDGSNQSPTTINSDETQYITVDMCQKISRVSESDESENDTPSDSDTNENETPSQSNTSSLNSTVSENVTDSESDLIYNNATQPANATASESDSVSTDATACPCYGTEVENAVGKCGVWSLETRFSKEICSSEEAVCDKYIVDLTETICIAKPSRGEVLEVTELSAGQMETCRSILQSRGGCAGQ